MNSVTAKRSIKGAMMATAAGAMVLAGTGVASATHLPAAPLPVTAANQMCGMVANSAGMGVHGATVTGVLSGTSWTASTTTNDTGGWCLQGDSTMAGDVRGGAYVTLTATSGGVTQTWTSGGSSNIDQWVFLAHGVWMGGLLPVSANGFNFTF